MSDIPRWGPRLARLYSVDIKRLEALHAGKLAPDTGSWGAAIEALYDRLRDLGPVKGAKLIRKVADYLNGIDRDERIHFTASGRFGSRAAELIFTTCRYGQHPDPAVQEEGLTIALHSIECSRSLSSWVSGIPVAFISRHAMNRLYERSGIAENSHATAAFAMAGVLGLLTHLSPKHADGDLNLLFCGLLLAGSMHRCTLTLRSKRPSEERFLDVRTVLPADELGDSRYAQIEQGRIASAAVLAWLEGDADEDENAFAETIPFLPRRTDTYPNSVKNMRSA